MLDPNGKKVSKTTIEVDECPLYLYGFDLA